MPASAAFTKIVILLGVPSFRPLDCLAEILGRRLAALLSVPVRTAMPLVSRRMESFSNVDVWQLAVLQLTPKFVSAMASLRENALTGDACGCTKKAPTAVSTGRRPRGA